MREVMEETGLAVAAVHLIGDRMADRSDGERPMAATTAIALRSVRLHLWAFCTDMRKN